MTIYELQAIARQAEATRAAQAAADLGAYAAQWDYDSAGAEQRLARYADDYDAGGIVPAGEDEVPVWLVDPRLLAVIMLVSIAIIVVSVLS